MAPPNEPAPKPKPRRHLPVLKNTPEEEEEAEPQRPPWQWAVLTGATTLLVWLLLAAIVNMIASAALGGVLVAVISFQVIALLVSAAAGGALCGRFGLRAKRAHAMGGAASVAVFGWALAFSRRVGHDADAVWAMTLGIMVALSVLGAAGGFALSRRGAK